MIKLTKDFFKIVDEFNDYICSDIDKSTIFNNRVEERFVNVLDVQSKCFDEQLNNINAILNCDFTDINNLPKISSISRKSPPLPRIDTPIWFNAFSAFAIAKSTSSIEPSNSSMACFCWRVLAVHFCYFRSFRATDYLLLDSGGGTSLGHYSIPPTSLYLHF